LEIILALGARLPDFEHPPLNEVSLSVQFAALTAMTSAHVGLFWNHIRSQYPKVSEHPPVDPSFEVFGASTSRLFQVPQLQINALLKLPVPRFWFETDAGQDLLQLQQDHMYRNWRHRKDGDVYPRYEYVRDGLRSDFEKFAKFVQSEKLGEIRPNQADVTYVNIIKFNPEADPHKEVERVLSIANPWPKGEDLPELENTLIQSRAILHRDGQPTCRLYVQLQPVIIPDTGQPAMRLEITARGKPNGESLHDVFNLLDFAHEGVVRTFGAITTRAMHKEWGRKDVH
jgi:uncharacterized protein (TIGR04255 family)